MQKVKGTRDILPTESSIWRYVEEAIKTDFINFNFKEIKVPTFEYTELFERSVGGTTDVVQKEMYTFKDKGNRSITLRPEGTAGVVRAYLENGMASEPSPVKLFYCMPMFRYENVQKGRQREFHQMGVECIGSESYLADFQVISLAYQILDGMRMGDASTLKLNSIGCKKCRAEYQKELKEYIRPNLEKYCEDCKSRFEKNPLRILDCKEETCKKLNKNAPKMLDFLCEECKDHFENLKSYLDETGIEYEIDPKLVRGLDYYTKTVFEFVLDDGLTVIGGGRYDDLIEQMGGQSTPAVGFAIGMERFIEAYLKYEDKLQIQEIIDLESPELFIVTIGEQARKKGMQLFKELQENLNRVEIDLMDRSVKAQMKYANKIKAHYSLSIGSREVEEGKAKIKDLTNGEIQEVELDEEAIEDAISGINGDLTDFEEFQERFRDIFDGFDED